ncbi:SDR family NAD(P)-dependent oxidoreductase [Azorhizobium doebereinerae]|uniref:SDR family NAD(P)-dependent oxidoreductase n=1 Tax=Azorhizobium doebereinerae TaxID=281091 RepID=UPI0004122FFC|nr:SDR family oxidoreductase [Azorhizobium doebereinerae]
MTKISLVTGASRGLGRNTALHLAEKGNDVIVTYHSSGDAAQAMVAQVEAMGRKALAFQLDSGDVAAFAPFADRLRMALRETWGRETFDHLVNNAGHGAYASIAQTSEAQFDALVNVHFKGVFFLTQALLPPSEAQFDALVNVHFKGVFFLTQALLPLIADGGRIVNISSGLTRMSLPGYAAYAAAKGAVEVLTRYMAKEWGARGIAVNTVAPGAIETDFGGGVVRDNPQINRDLADVTALGRVGLPDDIGRMISSLLADDNQWVNAQRIEVSGGQGL